MILRALLALLLSVELMTFAIAQSPREPMSSRLGDIMLVKQWRRIKLWFAGRQENWELAAYELAQIKSSLADAATLYANIPIDDVEIMLEPLQSINTAIETRDRVGFTGAFSRLKVACNSCHREMGRDFILVTSAHSLAVQRSKFLLFKETVTLRAPSGSKNFGQTRLDGNSLAQGPI
jgi:hypothetical protein